MDKILLIATIILGIFFIGLLIVFYKARKEVKQFEESQYHEEEKCNVSTTYTNENNKDKTDKSVTVTYADGKSFKVTPKKSSYTCKPRTTTNNYHHNHIDFSPDLLTTLVAAEIIEDIVEDHCEDNHCDYNDCNCQNDNNYESNYSSSSSDYESSYDSGDSYSSYDSSSSYDSGSCGSSDW